MLLLNISEHILSILQSFMEHSLSAKCCARNGVYGDGRTPETLQSHHEATNSFSKCDQ